MCIYVENQAPKLTQLTKSQTTTRLKVVTNSTNKPLYICFKEKGKKPTEVKFNAL